MKTKIAILMLFLAPFYLQAQTIITDFKDLADKAFANKEYYAAAIYYQKAIDNQRNDKTDSKPYQANIKLKKNKYSLVYINYQLAESFRLYRNFVNAVPWYYQVLQQPEANQYPLTRYYYGICLRATQQFDEAIKQLNLYLAATHTDKSFDERAKTEIANCNFAKQQLDFPKNIKINRMIGNWNSDGSNYSLDKNLDKSYLFTSSRYTAADSLKKIKPHLNRIFYAGKNSTNHADLSEIRFDKNLLSDNAEWGTPALSPNSKTMYFTYWFKNGNDVSHDIYRAENLGNGNWSAPQKLNININMPGFDAIQPFITADGKQLFFASNKPGSKGGYDLWVSDLDDQGNPLPSVNLGDLINTKSDEQAPNYDPQQKKLVYSSKGFVGLGGFDFMESFGSEGHWTKPENLGYPMNSPKDDLYYAVDPEDANLAYISSDRQSECCLELFTVKNSTYQINGLLLDCNQPKMLDSANVILTDLQSGKVVSKKITSLDGKYKFDVKEQKEFGLIIEKDNYFTKVTKVTSHLDTRIDTLKNYEICLTSFTKGKAIVLKNIFFDYNKANLRDQSKIELDHLLEIMKNNPKIRIELSAHTDSVGGNNYNVKLSQLRAQSCADYLTEMGIAAERIFAKGYGKNRPVAPNSLPNGKDNPAGRQLNRRTEFTVL